MPVIPHDNDVLFGRGVTIASHPGNRHLRTIVQAQKASFLKAKKKQKREIAKCIVNEISLLDPPGRFLIEDPNSRRTTSDIENNEEKDGISDKIWMPVETEKAVEKVMHGLREKDRPAPRSLAQKRAQQHPQQHLMSLVDPMSVMQQQAAVAQLALNPNFAGLMGGVDVQTGLVNLQLQQQLQPEQVNSAENNYLEGMQQSIDSNFLAKLASDNICPGQQNQNQNQQILQQATTNNILQQQLNDLQQSENLIQQQLNTIGQQSPEVAIGASDIEQTIQQINDLQHSIQQQDPAGMENVDNIMFGSHHQSAESGLPDGISTMNQGINGLQQNQNQQFTIGLHSSTPSGLTGTSCVNQGKNMNQSSNIDQSINRQIQNQQFLSASGMTDVSASGLSQGNSTNQSNNMNQSMDLQKLQFTIQPFVGAPDGLNINSNNNSTSPPTLSDTNMMNTNTQQIFGGMMHSNIGNEKSIGLPALPDTIGDQIQQQSSSQQQMYMGSHILSGGESMVIPQMAPTTALWDAPSGHTSVEMNTPYMATHDQGTAYQTIDNLNQGVGGTSNGNSVGFSSGPSASMLLNLHQDAAMGEATPSNFDVNDENFENAMTSFLNNSDLFDNVASSYNHSSQDQLMASNQNQCSPATAPPEHQQKQQHTSPGTQELTLRCWIDTFNPLRIFSSGYNQEGNNAEMLSYIKSLVIPLAIKLTEQLTYGEESTGNHVEPSSITCENISVRIKIEGTIIDQVIIKSSRRMSFDNTSKSPFEGVSGLLFALGSTLYEVLSLEPLRLDTTGSSDATALKRLSLENSNNGTLDNSGHDGSINRPSKRSQRSGSSFSINTDAVAANDQTHAKFIAKLESIGIPYSLCALVNNLLDRAQGDFGSDDVYQSLSDVLTDLHLMHTDPECFLNNLTAAASVSGPNFSFEIRSKLYGREENIFKIEEAYRRHTNGGRCSGIVMSGGAGVGKSSLVLEVTKKLAMQSKSTYFLGAKFQNNDVSHPLSTIGAMFDSLCELFARDATQDELKAVAEVLEKSLGSQTASLAKVLPSLTKLTNISASSMDSKGASNECIDPTASMQFLLRKLLEALNRYRRMTFVLDDLQWADPLSLQLIASLITSNKGSSDNFYACCYRDDDIQEGDSFTLWLSSINMFPLEVMELRGISTEGINELVSETLHLFPRLTHQLASILHHKTRGNPLFLRQLLNSLRDQGCIHFSFSPPRWRWNIDKIMDMSITDNVLESFINDLQRLQPELQMALKVASCIGSCIKYSIFDILSKDLKVDLRGLLSQAAEKGFMIDVNKTRIQWAHDKIQQAAYEMMDEQQRLKNHTRFGLAICSHALNCNSVESDELFFLAINQINRGGANMLEDTEQKVMVAKLNLKAGKRSIELSDVGTALRFFEHGISFLDKEERWTTNYEICLDLSDNGLEVACALNDAAAVKRLSEQVLAHATKNTDDKLNCLYAAAKSLRLAFKFIDSKNLSFTILKQLGERLPRPSDEVGVMADIQDMKLVLLKMTDDSIFNLPETNQRERDVLLMNLFDDLTFLFQFVEPGRIVDISLRMVQLSLSNGLCCMSPLAFARFAVTLINNTEDYALGYRLGMLSLRLLDEINNAQRYTSAVIALVGHFVSWVSVPLQSIGESHLLGLKHGQRNGDVISTTLNHNFHLQIDFFTGQALAKCRDMAREFALELVQRKQQFCLNGACCLYLQAVAMIDGLDFKERAEGLPTWVDIAESRAGKHLDFYLIFSTHRYMRAVMFKMYNDLPENGLLDIIMAKRVPLRPIFCYGIFFEGLVSCHLARQTDGDEYQRKGEAALIFFRNLSKCNRHNFESKDLLLEAEMMKLCGDCTQASQLYEDAIRSSHEHKFIHEEAIASELAGMHHHEMGLLHKSHALFSHSVECYKKWGALAISKRVEDIIESKFGSNFSHQPGSMDIFLSSVLAPTGDSSKKRPD